MIYKSRVGHGDWVFQYQFSFANMSKSQFAFQKNKQIEFVLMTFDVIANYVNLAHFGHV